MLLLLGALLAPLAGAPALSGASSGPDLGERAVAVDLPITDVAVFSDRARVTRAGPVRFTGGPQVVRTPDLPGGLMLDSLRVTATGARVVRVETAPVERERWSIDQVDAWIVQLETLGDQIAVVGGRLAAARSELALLSGLQVAPPLPEKDRLGKPVQPAADAWRAAQDQLARRRAAARVVERDAERELRELAKKYQQVQREVQQRDLGGYTFQGIEVLVIVDGAGAGNGTLSVEYGVPGAFWKPAYDLFFDPDGPTSEPGGGKVELKASGLVSQATGEDWVGVKLALSTAIPGRGIDMPELRTWTLGDDREYVPVPTARSQPRTTRPFSPPAARRRVAELEREADRSVLAERSDLLLSMAEAPVEDVVAAGMPLINLIGSSVGDATLMDGQVFTGGGVATGRGGATGSGRGVGFSDVTIEGRVARPDGAASRRAPRAPASMAPPPMMPQEDAEYAPVSESADSDDAWGSTTSSRSRLNNAEPVRMKSLALSGGIGWRRQTFSDPTLPAVTAGGFDYVYDAPVQVSVPSHATGLRVPLAVRSYDVRTFYEATPSLATTAYLKAVVQNGSKLPILAGPANVFVKRTFSGDAQLATTGPGGALELPLGADEDIRLTRTVIPSTKTQGILFGKEDVTDYAVKIEIGNYKKRAITLRVVDQVPKTNAEKIKIEMVVVAPKPQERPDADGLLHWHVDVPAGATRTVTFTYRITRPKDWRLSQ